ncbi:alpha/beta hydrolase [Streptomyces sp. M19]
MGADPAGVQRRRAGGRQRPGRDVPPLFRKYLEAGSLPVPELLRGEPSRAVVTSVLCTLGTAMIHAQWPPPPAGRFTRTPFLFMSGERDPIIPPSSVDALAERYPQAETHVFPGAGHLLALRSDPEGYANVVLDFLKRAMG